MWPLMDRSIVSPAVAVLVAATFHFLTAAQLRVEFQVGPNSLTIHSLRGFLARQRGLAQHLFV